MVRGQITCRRSQPGPQLVVSLNSRRSATGRRTSPGVRNARSASPRFPKPVSSMRLVTLVHAGAPCQPCGWLLKKLTSAGRCLASCTSARPSPYNSRGLSLRHAADGYDSTNATRTLRNSKSPLFDRLRPAKVSAWSFAGVRPPPTTSNSFFGRRVRAPQGPRGCCDPRRIKRSREAPTQVATTLGNVSARSVTKSMIQREIAVERCVPLSRSVAVSFVVARSSRDGSIGNQRRAAVLAPQSVL